MPFIEDEGGKLNNFAKEPQMYQAEEPNPTEKRNYVIFAVLAFLLLGGVIAVAVYASGAS